ncbi:hypothetical protein [Pseudoduganella namucuonensis]|uniref:Uncharacterized protein n=1 Tax=Pseudoduganella namucuonensis TaxID=1035707 RepID=A0A1I7IN85_9BURK|nr:hypothetical protein [Pseudoduganella namucuonensis]SFU74382.1 hypothetical protein SAMN05216552_1008165 [Pseudoduganella namucuonensis]
MESMESTDPKYNNVKINALIFDSADRGSPERFSLKYGTFDKILPKKFIELQMVENGVKIMWLWLETRLEKETGIKKKISGQDECESIQDVADCVYALTGKDKP